MNRKILIRIVIAAFICTTCIILYTVFWGKAVPDGSDGIVEGIAGIGENLTSTDIIDDTTYFISH